MSITNPSKKSWIFFQRMQYTRQRPVKKIAKDVKKVAKNHVFSWSNVTHTRADAVFYTEKLTRTLTQSAPVSSLPHVLVY
jgi:hypothetical protein